jgi:hypothetical protein
VLRKGKKTSRPLREDDRAEQCEASARRHSIWLMERESRSVVWKQQLRSPPDYFATERRALLDPFVNGPSLKSCRWTVGESSANYCSLENLPGA